VKLGGGEGKSYRFTQKQKDEMSIAMKSSKKHKDAIKKRDTPEHREKMAAVARETTKKRKKYDVWNKGEVGLYITSQETKSLMSSQRVGRKWFNDGIKDYHRFEKEEDDWYIGRKRNKKLG
jgi:hypothetical protein